MKLIVSDASPLIVIAKSGLIPMLNGMVDEVVIPETVYAECTRDPRLPGAEAVRAAVDAGRIHIRRDMAGSDGGPNVEAAGLDSGELAASVSLCGAALPRAHGRAPRTAGGAAARADGDR